MISSSEGVEASAVDPVEPLVHFRTSREDDLMLWSKKYSVGVGIIDREHHELFDVINDVQAAVTVRQDRECIGALLRELAEATRAHFASEEAMMEKAQYNGKMLHALKHQRLQEQLDAFVARFDRGVDLNKHSLTFMRDWFLPHILETDCNFGVWHVEHSRK
jgi:hemerythrin